MYLLPHLAIDPHFHSLNEDRGTGEEAQTSAQEDERHDVADDDVGGDQGDPEEEPQVSDNEPDYSIESVDSIESQQNSNQDYEIDFGADRHISDHNDEPGQGAGQSVVPPSSLRKRDAAQKSICDEVRESDSSPEDGSPLCGAPEARRPVRTATSKGTVKTKHKPVVSISVHAPRMRDMNKRSAPSTNISVKLPFQSAEGGPEKK